MSRLFAALLVSLFITVPIADASQETRASATHTRNGPRIDAPAGPVTSGTAAEASQSQSDEALTFEWRFSVGGDLSWGDLPNYQNGAQTIESQLRALNYDTVESEVTDQVAGWSVGAEASLELTDWILARAAVNFGQFAEAASRTEGSRLNRPPSNVIFSSATTTDISFLAVDIGPGFTIGPVTLTPSVAPTFVTVHSVTTGSLLGAPLGQTPTQQVNADNEVTDEGKWSVGLSIRAELALTSWMSIGAGYRQMTVNDVFPAVNDGRFDRNLKVRTLSAGFRFYYP
jgi:hypothetical protein